MPSAAVSFRLEALNAATLFAVVSVKDSLKGAYLPLLSVATIVYSPGCVPVGMLTTLLYGPEDAFDISTAPFQPSMLYCATKPSGNVGFMPIRELPSSEVLSWMEIAPSSAETLTGTYWFIATV